MYIQANDPDILSLMKIIDEKGKVIPWEYNAFPDGQVQIKIKKEYIENDYQPNNFCNSFSMKVSIANSIIWDLFQQATSLLYFEDIKVNYLYGARCDKYQSNDYFVCNLAQQMNDWFFHEHSGENQIQFLAPHCVLKYKKCADFNLPLCVNLDDYDMIVFPDESAFKRYKNQVKDKNYVVCKKHRDQESGAIISHKIPNLPDGAKKVILLDDLVDGGKSFMNIAEILPTGMLADLFVFHGVLSNSALSKLLEKFNKVIVSNSLLAPQKQKDALSDEDKNRVVIFDVWS